MSNKTITINPEIFNMGGFNKTKKHKERKQRPNIIPLISPNSLKNKLLKRIKEHKTQETSNEKKDDKKNTISDIGIYTDEFNDSLAYLKSLSLEQRKNSKPLTTRIDSGPYVSLELPEELKEFPVTQVVTNDTIKINYRPEIDPPYGCLKGGTKPTFKAWNMTQKKYDATNPTLSITVGQENTASIERENRLKILKEKIKRKQDEKIQDELIMSANLIQPRKLSSSELPSQTQLQLQMPNTVLNEEVENANVFEVDVEPISTRQLIKKTTTRRYTLGKSNMHKKVGILIKNNNTRKQVLHAQRELKKKPINDVKKYLREHALLKSGSNAPNDVVRKMFESAMLAGEITNNNKDIILHNFLKNNE